MNSKDCQVIHNKVAGSVKQVDLICFLSISVLLNRIRHIDMDAS